MPQSSVPPGTPLAKPVPVLPALLPTGEGRWQINGWEMIEAGKANGGGEQLSQPGSVTTGWYKATVPGTVLQTLVDRGVYPDPYYGLNNLAIHERLARQDYWYRATFEVPAEAAGKMM